jgi:DNA-binding transcriptional regulator YdaS (Cro superfamily)
MNPEEALNKAVEIVGGQTALAKVLSVKTGRGIRQQHIWNWLNRDGGLPAAYAPLVQSLCEEHGGSISCNDLCPEFFPLGESELVQEN